MYSQHNNQPYGQQQGAPYGQQGAPYGQQGAYGQQGGAPPYGQAPPPPGGDPLWQYFSAVDQDRSGSISVMELQAALVNGNWSKFDLDTVKMLMGIFDTDRTGSIDFKEFSGLWKYISDWQNVFRHFDRDGSGSIEGRELSEAMRNFGYSLPPHVLSLLERKYSAAPTTARPGHGQPPAGITFDRFVRACVVVKTLTEAFQRVDTDRDGWVQMSYEQFMSITLSAP
ncbi:hypothetical protein FB45DRAFT_930938 [Roridomyces roridus]|uniref:EF-hand domain-containing protein n=1 Tax=Roridomyces roridus TaxID=1738132 RepID=A0AAD7BFR3_9AGAR|nr:hypothetical protein FB45DRAFT_930938 [Roridomyces roridus]